MVVAGPALCAAPSSFAAPAPVVEYFAPAAVHARRGTESLESVRHHNNAVYDMMKKCMEQLPLIIKSTSQADHDGRNAGAQFAGVPRSRKMIFAQFFFVQRSCVERSSCHFL